MKHTNIIEELKWRGMIHDVMPGTEEIVQKEMVTAYVGFDPTADSLGVGNLVPLMMLVHLQNAGHKPIVLVGGATGMIGDPSGKSEERNLLDEETLQHNVKCQSEQLRKFLNFDSGENKAELVNNLDWIKEFSLIDFLRDVGKRLTISYMLAKDSVQSRLEKGISFTEFSYQLIQGYDFYHLYKNYGCKLQMGGSDQWGNITAGTELIRRIDGGEAFGVTTSLITKPDGSKFGKTEAGNVWLDPQKTSAYSFYQFWINSPDSEAAQYLRIFTTLSKEEIERIIEEHEKAPHLRLLQKTLARDITSRVHSKEAMESAETTSAILFGKGAEEEIFKIDESNLLSALEGVPKFDVQSSEMSSGLNIVDLLTINAEVFASKGEVRRLIKEGALKINKAKVENEDLTVGSNNLIAEKYVLVQKGKKNYYLIATI